MTGIGSGLLRTHSENHNQRSAHVEGLHSRAPQVTPRRMEDGLTVQERIT